MFRLISLTYQRYMGLHPMASELWLPATYVNGSEW